MQSFFSSHPPCLPGSLSLFSPPLSPALSLCQCVQLAESGSLLSTLPSNCLSFLAPSLYPASSLKLFLPPRFSVSTPLSLLLSLLLSLPPCLPLHPPDLSPSTISSRKPSLTPPPDPASVPMSQAPRTVFLPFRVLTAISFFLNLCIYFYFWMCWVFVADFGLSLVAAAGGGGGEREQGYSS